MKLKIYDVNKIWNALRAIDSGGYEFRGKVRLDLADNFGAFKSKSEKLEKVNDDIIKQISGGKDRILKEETEKIAEYNRQAAEILDSEQDIVGAVKIKKSDLNLDKNQIPLSLLNDLAPILE